MHYLTLDDAITQFTRHLKRRPLSDNTRRAFISDLHIFKRYADADTFIHKIKADHINKFLASLERDHSPKTIERRLTTIKAFFTWLYDNTKITTNPADAIAYKPLIDELPTYLTHTQLTAVITAAHAIATSAKPEPRALLAILLVNETAIKRSECLRLTFDDFDITTPNAPAVNIHYPNLRHKSKQRRLNITPATMTLIQHSQSQRPRAKLIDCTGRNIEYIFNDRIAPLAGIQSLTFEMLRWTCAVRDYHEQYLTHKMNDQQMQLRYGLSVHGWFEMLAKLRRMDTTP